MKYPLHIIAGLNSCSLRLRPNVNTYDPMGRLVIFGRVLLFTLEKTHHAKSDKYFSLYSVIIYLGQFGNIQIFDVFKYQHWTISENCVWYIPALPREMRNGSAWRKGKEVASTTGDIELSLFISLLKKMQNQRDSAGPPSWRNSSLISHHFLPRSPNSLLWWLTVPWSHDPEWHSFRSVVYAFQYVAMMCHPNFLPAFQ